ncbi:MAG: DNA primase [Clostridiales bacterium]|nr:DNA primase [Clostridiales bacterium]
MKGFDVKFMDELKRKNDIIDIIGKYVRLEQRGGNFWGKCPFHHEKTASFSVNAQGQFYYCFGCRKSGDVISFIMEIESLDFNDAVKFLAERAKIPLPEVRYDDEKIRQQKKLRERLLSLLRETALFYVRTLKSEKGAPHYEYALSRKMTNETITKFGIGASPDFNSLVQHLRSLGFTNEEMVLSGAVGEKNGRYFDWLGGRLIIPVIDQFNNVIAFVGRRIDGGKEQKYINTKETLVFSKGKTFFNLNNLKKIKNEKGLSSVIIVEGHLDVVSLTQAGFGNVVATMGTALTKDQARILKRYTEKVLISYDGDFAGQKASIRGLEILSEEGLEVKVVSLPDGMDPDDVVKKLGEDGYRDLLNRSMPLIDFKLDILRRTYDVNTVDGKRKYITNAIRVIKESSSPAEQEDLLKTVRDVTGTTFEALKRELYSTEIKPKTENTEAPQFNDNAGDKTAIASRFILASYLFNKPYAKETDIADMEFLMPVHQEIQRYVLDRQKENARPQFSDLYEMISEEYADEISRIAGMEAEENKTFDQAVYFFDCVRTLKREAIDKKISALSRMFAQETDTEKRRELTAEMTRLLAKKKTELS